MRFGSCDEIYEDFFFLKGIIEKLDDENFPFMTKNEVKEEKAVWIEEIKMEYAFKLLTRIESELRMDFNETIASKHRDPLSKDLNALCDEYRKRKHQYSKSRGQVCKKIGFDSILLRLAKFFRAVQDSFHSSCSTLKGHLIFRHWYAHGRYFREPPPIPDPEDLVEIYDVLEAKVLNRSIRSAH